MLSDAYKHIFPFRINGIRVRRATVQNWQFFCATADEKDQRLQIPLGSWAKGSVDPGNTPQQLWTQPMDSCLQPPFHARGFCDRKIWQKLTETCRSLEKENSQRWCHPVSVSGLPITLSTEITHAAFRTCYIYRYFSSWEWKFTTVDNDCIIWREWCYRLVGQF